jgi:hypothetical protein
MMKKILKALFSQRRWIPWLPLPISAAVSLSELSAFPKIFVAGCVFWIPFWLAWWLSDGFEDCYLTDEKPKVPVLAIGNDPETGKPCIVARFCDHDTPI